MHVVSCSTRDLARVDFSPGQCREQAEGVGRGWVPSEKAGHHSGRVTPIVDDFQRSLNSGTHCVSRKRCPLF